MLSSVSTVTCETLLKDSVVKIIFEDSFTFIRVFLFSYTFDRALVYLAMLSTNCIYYCGYLQLLEIRSFLFSDTATASGIS